MGTYSGLSGLLIFCLFLLNGAVYVALWIRVETIRRTTRNSAALPSSAGLLWGWSMYSYVWSDRHQDAKDPALTRRVVLLRFTFALLISSGVILQIAG